MVNRRKNLQNSLLLLLGFVGCLTLATWSTESRSAAKADLKSSSRSYAINKETGPFQSSLPNSASWTRTPLSFEENQGQADKRIKFLAHMNDAMVLLSSDEASIRLNRSSYRREAGSSSDAVGIRFAGATHLTNLAGKERQAGTINYLVGHPSQWHTRVSSFAKVEYKQLYPGIDLLFYGNQQQLEYDFIVGAYADPSTIRLELIGITKVTLDQDGALMLQTASGSFRQSKPIMYQDANGTLKLVNGRYKLKPGHRIGLEVDCYDKSRPLIIDPVLTFGSYLGSGGGEEATAIATDANGNAYLTGYTDSAGLSTLSGRNVYVAKFNAAGTVREYLSVFGGAGDDEGKAIAVDSLGNVLVTGRTDSRDFGLANPLQQYGGGEHDAFVSKLKPDGSGFVYSTYFGGDGDDTASGIAVDPGGNAYITGATDSPEYSNLAGRNTFVAKLTSNGSELLYLAIVGGSGEDIGYAIALDSSGGAYVAGSTESTDLATASPVQSRFGGGIRDGFLAKLSATGSYVEYCTYFGGTGDDLASGIAVDASGNSYMTGSSDSPEITSTGRHVFVAKFNKDGSGRIYLNTFGGDREDAGNAIALDVAGNVYVTGSTNSANFAVLNAIQTAFGGGAKDAFVAELSSNGSALSYSTYLGGAGEDIGYGIAVTPSGQVFVAGATTSTDFPVMAALQGVNGGGSDAFLVRFSSGTAPSPSPTPIGTPTPTGSPTPPVLPRAAPILLTEPNSNRAIAFDSVTFARDPFPITTDLNFSTDKRTRMVLFVTNLELLPTEDHSAVTVRAVDSRGNTYVLTVEYVGEMPNFDWLSNVVVKLPDDQTISGDLSIVISLPGVNSNSASVRIRSP